MSTSLGRCPLCRIVLCRGTSTPCPQLKRRRSQACLSTCPLYAGATPQQSHCARSDDAATNPCHPCLPRPLRAPVETAAAGYSAVATHPAVRATATVTMGTALLLYLLGALHRWTTARVDMGRYVFQLSPSLSRAHTYKFTRSGSTAASWAFPIHGAARDAAVPWCSLALTGAARATPRQQRVGRA